MCLKGHVDFSAVELGPCHREALLLVLEEELFALGMAAQQLESSIGPPALVAAQRLEPLVSSVPLGTSAALW